MRLDVNIRLPYVRNPIRSSSRFRYQTTHIDKMQIARVRSVKRGFIGINLVQRRMMMLTRGKGESSQNSSVGHRRCHNRDGSVGFHAQPLDGGSMVLQHRLLSVSGGREKLRHFPKIVAQKICRSKKLPYLESSLSPENFPLKKNHIPYRTRDSFAVKFLFKDTKMHEAGTSLTYLTVVYAVTIIEGAITGGKHGALASTSRSERRAGSVLSLLRTFLPLRV